MTEPPKTTALDALQALAVRGLGPRAFRRLLERYGSWGEARRAPAQELMREGGLGEDVAAAVAKGDWQFDPEKELEAAERTGVRVMTWDDPAYPEGLRRLEDGPPALYVRGHLAREDALAVAVVGARRCSVYGEGQAERLAGGLADAGFCVISGLARGIDAAAHRGALKAGGRTLALMGCGLGRVYPPEHKDLADRVCQQGALVSALPLATRPHATNFPARNRLIAAMSLGTLVVEASRRSGALITARFAAEMGKEVFAVPGDVTRQQSWGCHALLRDGAKLVADVRDVIEELGTLSEVIALPDEKPEEPPLPRMNDIETRIFKALADSPRSIDEIVQETGAPASNVASALLALELRGAVRKLPGMMFARGKGRR